MTSQTDVNPTRIAETQPQRRPRVLWAAIVLLTAGAADAALTTNDCLAKKRQAWSSLRKCQANADVKRIKGKPADLATCQTQFDAKVAKIDEQAAKLAIACRYGDNGDQTVTDYDTGLMWEKKDGEIGGLCLSIPGAVNHCVNYTFATWSSAQTYVSHASEDGLAMVPFLAGHSDWRLPTILELQTILLAPYPCGTSPCIDPIFGPTLAGNDSDRIQYWSSTTAADDTRAWTVNFHDGHVTNSHKTPAVTVVISTVRAVRGGL